MAEKIRVHLLAEEIGVTSKAILDKCRAEGLNIRNHMSTLSAGQIATIREWFSEGSHGTTVEEAERVDLTKVRAAPKRRKSTAKGASHDAVAVAEAGGDDDTETSDERDGGVAVAEPETAAEAGHAVSEPVEPAAREDTGEAVETEPDIEPVEPETPGIALKPAAVIQPPAAPAAPETTEPTTAAAAAATAPPEAPAPPKEPVRPAGPINVPQPATLRGPRVVRVERPDILPVRPSGPRPPRGPAGGPPPEPTTTGPGRSKARGRGGRTETEEEAARKAHRVHPRRTGRGSEAGERLREWRDRDLIERQEKIQAASGRGIHARRAIEKAAHQSPAVASRKTQIEMTEPVILHEFCAATGIGMQQLAPRLIKEFNVLPTRNMVLDADRAQFLAMEFGIELIVRPAKTALDELREEFEQRPPGTLVKRPPVVTFLGHVDHGKTSLLDAIRKTRVVEGEAGGITQHIGAYRLDRDGLSVTFLDTPGHEAFTAMRARGANMTDVVVLVVAADDGVMPQTTEAINHAKAAKVPIVVALNKIDLPGANKNRVLGQLSEQGLIPQEWGGEVDVIETSATKGEGIDALVEHLSTLADILDLKADPAAPASGTVIEGQMREGIGAVARVLVQSGTLREGVILQCGPAAGRVRALMDDRGRRIPEAGPGTPVEVAGLDCVPDASDRFYEVSELQRAKEIAELVQRERRERAMVRLTRPRTLEDLHRQRMSGEIPVLNLILRADVQGSVDVLRKTLGDLPSDQVKLNILHAAVGSITESDVVLAEASKALIVGFHVMPDAASQRLADEKGVEIKVYRVIYNLTDDIRKALEGLLEPDRNEEDRGKAEVRQVFSVSRAGKVAGCYVTEGVIARSAYVRVLRDGRIILPTADDAERGRHRGLSSLRRFKDDASEVRAGFECGLKIENYDDVQPGDVIVAYEVVEVARTL